ncbi:actin cytoskeleton organization protein [Pseudohyphozyma bogoriensis]|nr:actin cytoskeleton organization protein [Pseudohyphozyma bogoriensis]
MFESLLSRPPTEAVVLSQADVEQLLAAHSSSPVDPAAKLVLARPIHDDALAALSSTLALALASPARAPALSLLANLVPYHPTVLSPDSRLRPALVHLLASSSEPATAAPDTDALTAVLANAAPLPALRELVRASAQPFLERVLGPRPDEAHISHVDGDPVAAAASSLAKARAALTMVILHLSKEEPVPGTGGPKGKGAESRWSLDALAQTLVVRLEPSADEPTLLAALEALAYLTLSPAISSAAIKSIVPAAALCALPPSPALSYPLSTVLLNLTAYPPAPNVLRIPTQNNPLEPRESVSSRVSQLVAHKDFVPLLVRLAKSESPAARTNIAKSLLAVAEDKLNRPQMITAGAGKSLLLIIAAVPSSQANPDPNQPAPPPATTTLLPAIQALAKLLITAQPSLVFTPTLLQDAGRALVLPLSLSDSDTPDDVATLLIQFECLMALTNVAACAFSLQDFLTRLIVPSLATPSLLTTPTPTPGGTPLLVIVESLILSQNLMIRRAAAELLCNIVGTPASVAFYAPPPPPKPHPKLNLLAALVASEDLATRMATSAALAGLADSSEEIARALFRAEKGFSNVLELLNVDEDPGLRLRGWHVVRSVTEAMSSSGSDAEAAEKKRAMLKTLEGKVEDETMEEALEVAKEAVDALRKRL